MRLKLDDVYIPLGITRRFMQRYDEIFMGKEEEISDFALDVEYPPLDYDGDYRWSEMSYNKYTETSLTWHYDIYSCEN
jgi:hypothetical protein